MYTGSPPTSFTAGHSQRVNTGTAIGLHLRVYRIRSVDFIEDELCYIINTSIRLPYLVLLRLKDKRKKIMNRQSRDEVEKVGKLTLPSRKGLNGVERILARCKITVANPVGTTIRDLIRLNSIKRSQAGE